MIAKKNTTKDWLREGVFLFLAGVFIGLSFMQLFDLASFIEIIQKILVSWPRGVVAFLVIKAIFLEISALPFLLDLNFNKRIKKYSLAASWLSLLIWSSLLAWMVVVGCFGSFNFLGGR